MNKISEFLYATGKRKTAIACVNLYTNGNGNIIINGKKIDEYFLRFSHKQKINYPFFITDTNNIYDIICSVKGSGLSSQSDAIKHGISKILSNYNKYYHSILRKNNLLTRDSRKVERKKYGLKKSRKKFQFSKR